MKLLSMTLMAIGLAAVVGTAAGQSRPPTQHASPSPVSEGCVGLENILASKPGSVTGEFLNGVKALFMEASPQECGSLTSVMQNVVNRKRIGGRKGVIPNLPIDSAKVEERRHADLERALQDPQIRARLDRARQGITDINTRIVYEAALLGSAGYHDARELRIQELLQNLENEGR